MKRILFFFLISEKDIMAFGEDDEGERKRIQEVKDKDGILTGIALREKLLSVMLFKAHFLLNLFAFSKYHKRCDFFQHFIMKNFKNPEKLKEFYTEYVIPITYILRLTFYYTCIYLSLNSSVRLSIHLNFWMYFKVSYRHQYSSL